MSKLGCSIAMLVAMSGCGGSRKAREEMPTTSLPHAREPEAAPAPAPVAEIDPEEDALRRWAIGAAGREDATSFLIESTRVPAGSPIAEVDGARLFRVRATDGATRLDAWVRVRADEGELRVESRARDHWAVAELLARATAAGARGLRIPAEAEALPEERVWILGDRTLVCRAAECFRLEPAQVGWFDCAHEQTRTCSLSLQDEHGRQDRWEIDLGPTPRRRRVGTRAASPDRLLGPARAPERRTRGAWIALEPDGAPAPAVTLAIPGSTWVDGSADGTCALHLDAIARPAGWAQLARCGSPMPWEGDGSVVALRVTEGERVIATPSFDSDANEVDLDRFFDLHDLIGERGGAGVVVQTSNAGSPSGSDAEELWVLTEAPNGPRVASVRLASSRRFGLGAGDEGEGYVVAVSRRRADLVVTGPGRATVRRLQTWSGTHARASDRWDGVARTERRDTVLSFDVEQGFRQSDGQPCRLVDRDCAAHDPPE